MPSSFHDAAQVCEDGIGKYAALRPELFKQILLLIKHPGGPWRVQYKIDPAEGDTSLPVKVSHHTATVTELNGQPFNGIATVHEPHTHAPFKDFVLLNPGGHGPVDGSEAQVLEMRLKFLLQQLLSTVKGIAGALAAIEREAVVVCATVDTVPLSRLALALPAFPYWPRIKGMTEADFDRIICEEKPLLDEALLALHRLKLYCAPAAATKVEAEPVAAANHSKDFTTVNWYGTSYVFDDGLQAKAVSCLWEEYLRGEHGRSEKSIGKAIKSAAGNYRLASTFKNHPAWGTMIVKVRQGIYRLRKPE